MPIWDEEWVVRDDESALVRDATNGREIAVFDVPVTEDDPLFQEKAELADRRAILAAAAPAMARLLLSLEWAAGGSWGPSGDESTNTNFACALCEGTRGEWVARSGTKYPAGHAPDCQWLAVMRAAGVRE